MKSDWEYHVFEANGDHRRYRWDNDSMAMTNLAAVRSETGSFKAIVDLGTLVIAQSTDNATIFIYRVETWRKGV